MGKGREDREGSRAGRAGRTHREQIETGEREKGGREKEIARRKEVEILAPYISVAQMPHKFRHPIIRIFLVLGSAKFGKVRQGSARFGRFGWARLGGLRS
jgi:hypothetical protein